MEQFTTVEGLKAGLASRRGSSVGFVPTMGALHEGHVSLVKRARAENDTVVVSVFVNPTQFNDKEDLRNYPRTPEADLEVLRAAGADVVFMPSVEEVYPEPDMRVFDFGMLDKVMEGATRPGHFNGVAQVVSRLFEFVEPDRAYFGEKDFQQIAVIKALVKQLGFESRHRRVPHRSGSRRTGALFAQPAAPSAAQSGRSGHPYGPTRGCRTGRTAERSRRMRCGDSPYRSRTAVEGNLFQAGG